MKERLDKILSNLGIGSRKEVNRLIRKGKVKVNGFLVRDASLKFDPSQIIIEVEDRIISRAFTEFYYKFYKPRGLVTSMSDRDGPYIFEKIPETLPGYKKIFPVGRLDKDAEGLLLLISDGLLAHRLLHPKWKVPKVYEVLLDRELSEEDKKLIEGGIDLKEGKTLPCKIEFLSVPRGIKIEVIEGRYHLIKRIFGKLGYRVERLKRISIGPISLGNLKEGEVTPLSPEEINNLKLSVNLSQ